jgi:penicillin-binding protein 1A
MSTTPSRCRHALQSRLSPQLRGRRRSADRLDALAGNAAMPCPHLHLLQLTRLVVTAALVVASPADAALLPSIDPIVDYSPKQPLRVLTADGVEIAQFGTERRQYLPLAQTPKLLRDTVLAVEDVRFHEHSGVDIKGIARAVMAMMSGGERQGASTITQQLVRTMLLTRERTAERKLKEMVLALRVEQALSKDRILEIYLNEIYLGQRAYGFAAAAQAYFGKPLDQLSIAETAMLAGLPQNPNFANPVADFERAQARQRVVLDRMRDTGVIDARQHAAARAEALRIRPPGQRLVIAPHVAEMARQAVVQRFGEAAYTGGYQVLTSLYAADQQAAHAAVRRGVLAYDRRNAWRGPEGSETLSAGDGDAVERAAAQALKDYRDDDLLHAGIVLSASPQALRVQLASGERISVGGDGLGWVHAALQPAAKAPLRIERGAVLRLLHDGKSWAVSQWPEVEAALVAMNPGTGRVRALVGSFDFTRQPFNHVTQGWRQPGSSFKPLLYSAAIESGVMPGTVIDDLPFTAGNGWSPVNSDGQFLGPITLGEALAKSRNIVSVRLLQVVGTTRVRQWTGRFGLDPARQPDDLTLALGTGSVTPMQMAQAYSTFANGGHRLSPVLIERISDAQGKVVFEAPPAPRLGDETRTIPARNAYLTASLLNEVTRSGTAASAQAKLRRADLYGKTGTTNDVLDAWFAGFQPTLTAVVWMGHSEPRSLGDRETGARMALPIWIDYMGSALRGVPAAPLKAPAGLSTSRGYSVYAELANGGWIERISADTGVARAGPPEAAAQSGEAGAGRAASAAPASPPGAMSAPAPVRTTGGEGQAPAAAASVP